MNLSADRTGAAKIRRKSHRRPSQSALNITYTPAWDRGMKREHEELKMCVCVCVKSFTECSVTLACSHSSCLSRSILLTFSFSLCSFMSFYFFYFLQFLSLLLFISLSLSTVTCISMNVSFGRLGRVHPVSEMDMIWDLPSN